MHHLKLLALAGLIATAPPMVALAQPGQSAVAFRAKLNVNPASPAEVAAACDAYLQRAAADRVALEARTGPATVAGDLRAYDTMAVTLNSARFDAAIVANTNPDEAKRNAARACQAKVQEALTGLGLSLPIYTRLKGIDTSKLAPELRHPLSRVIQEYERNGVAGGPEAAAKVVALQKRINIASINFARGIADGRKTVTATPAELEGLPADYLEHPVITRNRSRSWLGSLRTRLG